MERRRKLHVCSHGGTKFMGYAVGNNSETKGEVISHQYRSLLITRTTYKTSSIDVLETEISLGSNCSCTLPNQTFPSLSIVNLPFLLATNSLTSNTLRGRVAVHTFQTTNLCLRLLSPLKIWNLYLIRRFLLRDRQYEFLNEFWSSSWELLLFLIQKPLIELDMNL